ncbi:MAG TPA: helix-turn-helix domain-containing protein [Candidatus Polarisedimenticolaceae bacterium]
MRADKRRRLEKAGWRVGDAADFLELTPEERAYVELKLALAEALQERRAELGWTQAALAVAAGSSQSRVAKMEAGDGSVTLDLLVRALLVVGVSRGDLAALISGKSAGRRPKRTYSGGKTRSRG